MPFSRSSEINAIIFPFLIDVTGFDLTGKEAEHLLDEVMQAQGSVLTNKSWRIVLVVTSNISAKSSNGVGCSLLACKKLNKFSRLKSVVHQGPEHHLCLNRPRLYPQLNILFSLVQPLLL